MSFSERKGLVQKKAIQIDSMDEELRNSLWNILDITLWTRTGVLITPRGDTGLIDHFSKLLWLSYFKKPIDTRPEGYQHARGYEILQVIRKYFFSCSWNEVYDFLEFVLAREKIFGPSLILSEGLNNVLRNEVAGYQVMDGIFVQITDDNELEALTQALEDTKFSAVSSHLRRALELLSDRKNPDYRNSIKESVSAVESLAKVVAKSDKGTLADALKVLEKERNLHPALKEGFLKLYGFTSDANGIRHAMMEKPSLDQADARYFLLSCTSFCNYLKSSLA